MNNTMPYDTYGFRFLDTLGRAFCQLYAVGFDKVTSQDYDWDGLKRIDGPLFLFQYTLSGFGHVEVDGVTYKVEPGAAFMVEIPSSHRYYLPSSSESWEFYFMLMRPNTISEQWHELNQQIGPVVQIPRESSVILLLQDVVHAASKKHITDGYRASSIVYQFMMELYRFSTSYQKEKEAWPPKIQMAVEQMEQHYKILQSLEDIAQSVELSKYHFTRSFTKATGYTPIEYLTKIRIEHAVRLLRETDVTIEEIARTVGYANGSYFIKVFRKWIGFSPGDFRAGRQLTSINQLKIE
ncbi:helix-turn-helix domain-containing protein [Bacillus suaedae]|uniref:AraC family transcriptional regulator n=1 Tax=Halalkalibacter suaedae TaxID=2822140 RepID=A0A941AT58_9BACI|nr:AraC family transcriptional regulator [Bacillus suaedae]MBP3950939.1 AraC family transcriptional regulator [Bacillus suaedae]